MGESEFWINGDGQNLLKGVPDDPANPIRLSDAYIVEFLLHIPSARASYDRLFPLLLPEEQARLSPFRQAAISEMYLDYVEESDRFQAIFTKAGVHRGGEWAPPSGGV